MSVKTSLCGSQQCDAATELEPSHNETSEQHKDLSQARQTRDTADSEKLMSFIEWRSPFDEDQSLRNIVSGITSRPEVNVHHTKQVGVGILY